MCAKNFIVSLFNRLVNHNFIMHIGITVVAASNTATDDVRKLFTYRTFNANSRYSSAQLILKIEEISGLAGGF